MVAVSINRGDPVLLTHAAAGPENQEV